MKNAITFDPADDATKRLIADQAAQFREVLAGESRSTTLTQLLDYLLERSGDPRAPKEIEIAMAVFGKNSQFDTSQDSTVRVHIHRLRQRLESFNAGKGGRRLHLPKGEYRLLLADELTDPDEDIELSVQPQTHLGNKGVWILGAIGFSATTALWAALLLIGHGQSAPVSSIAQTSFWKPIAAHKRLPLIAAGDFYMVAESGASGKIERLSMRPTIRSGRDLDNYLRMHPDQYSRLRDRDIHRVPAKVATGAAAILPLVAAVRPDHGTATILPVSQISQETIDSNNVIYIEHFSELGMLRSPILHLSAFAPGTGFNELKDLPSGKIFQARHASENRSNDGSSSNDPYDYDYGYIASYPSPSGNQIIVISGLEDAALAQMVKLVSDKRQLDFLSRKTRGAKSFEALYQVRTTGGLTFDTNLLIARALEPGRGMNNSP